MAKDTVQFAIELEKEEDGRWIGEVPDLPGVLAYGQNRDEAIARAQALALRVLVERLEHGEPPNFLSVSFRAAGAAGRVPKLVKSSLRLSISVGPSSGSQVRTELSPVRAGRITCGHSMTVTRLGQRCSRGSRSILDCGLRTSSSAAHLPNKRLKLAARVH